MQQYEQIIEDMLTILSADADPTEEAIRDADTRYADAVNATNQRLMECVKLMHKGFRTEAIQKCETDPNLLDLVAILDFPEAPQWTVYVQQFGLPATPQVRTEVAADLNLAYNAQASLADWLQQHRLLALARAPLPERLKILRQIAQRDTGNPVWQQDIRSWEQTRQDRLPQELDAAVAQNDIKRLALLEQEVRGKDWLEPPAKPLVERVVQAHLQCRVREAQRRLAALEKELTRAYANFDVTRARILRTRWQALAAIGIQRADDPLAALAAPALEWLREEDRRDQEEKDWTAALAAVGHGLDAGVKRQELERLEHAALRFERGGLPEPLAKRLDERYARLATKDTRTSRLVLVSVISAAILLAAGITWAVVANNRQRELATHAANLQQLLQNKSLQEATAYLGDLEKDSPQVFQSPAVQKLAKDLEAAVRANDQRLERFDQALSDARRHGQSWEGYGTALDAIIVAEKLAANDAERRQLEQVRGEVQTKRLELQRGLDEAFVADLKAFSERFDRLDLQDLAGIENLRAAGDMLAKRPFVSSILKNPIRPLLDRLKTLYDNELARRGETGLAEQITDAVGDRVRYAQALQSFVAGFPSKARAADFKRVLENEAKLLEGVECWNKLVAPWSQRDFRQVSADDAPALIEAAETLLKQYPGFPGENPLRELVTCLTAVRHRVGDDGNRITVPLTESLQGRHLVQLRMLMTAGGKRYYFSDKPPRIVAMNWTVEHFVDFGLDQVQRAEIRADQVVNGPRVGAAKESPGEATTLWLAPQREFSDFALERLIRLTDVGWETTFCEILKRLHESTAMEPILQIQLLARIIEVACTGSSPMQRSFGKNFELIRSTNLNESANWVNPEDMEGQRTRIIAANLVRRLESPESAEIRVNQYRDAMNRPRLGPQYLWVGWLQREADSRWICTLPRDLSSRSGELYVAVPTAAGGPQFTRVGTMTAGTATLQVGTTGATVEGRPVFLLSEAARM